MWRASVALVCTCLVIGCSPPDPIGLPQSVDRGIDPTDAVAQDQMVSDAQPMDSGVELDVGAPDTGRTDSEPPDAGGMTTACSTIHSDAVPIALPTAEQVTAAYGGALTYLAWADSNGVHQCAVGQSGAFEETVLPSDLFGHPDCLPAYQRYHVGCVWCTGPSNSTLPGTPTRRDPGNP